MDEKQIIADLGILKGQMQQFLMAAANGIIAREKLEDRVMAIELSMARLTGRGQVVQRAFDIFVGACMAILGAYAFKVFS